MRLVEMIRIQEHGKYLQGGHAMRSARRDRRSILRCLQLLDFRNVMPTLGLCRHRQTHRQAGVVSTIQRPDGIDERLDIVRGAPARRERAQLVLDLSVAKRARETAARRRYVDNAARSVLGPHRAVKRRRRRLFHPARHGPWRAVPERQDHGHRRQCIARGSPRRTATLPPRYAGRSPVPRGRSSHSGGQRVRRGEDGRAPRCASMDSSANPGSWRSASAASMTGWTTMPPG